MAGAAIAGSLQLLSCRRRSCKSNQFRNCLSCASLSLTDGTFSTGMFDGSMNLYRWKMVIAYDGTAFSGWQYQESVPTVQCIIEKALMRITKDERKDLCLVGASRTDAGVHAWGQVAHFETTSNYEDLEGFHTAINGLLPHDIRVREICPAGPEFHARFSTESKIYHYKIYNRPVMDPFQTRYAYHSGYMLNSTIMREAAQYFVGKHDFTSFANASRNDRVINPVKEIFRFDVVELGPMLQLEVEGSGFLFRQVRNMVDGSVGGRMPGRVSSCPRVGSWTVPKLNRRPVRAISGPGRGVVENREPSGAGRHQGPGTGWGREASGMGPFRS